MRRYGLLIAVFVLLVGLHFWHESRQKKVVVVESPADTEAPQIQPEALPKLEPPKAQPAPSKPKPKLKAKPKPKKKAKPKLVKKPPPPSPAPIKPPPVQLFTELIPENIEIVRFYYSQQFIGPASSIEFDINGSGFTKEFEKMIRVNSGHPQVAVENLELITPNQIHGTLNIDKEAPTKAIFPQVLIQDKVVFQAPEPFAVIRPGEVLNLIFTEMGESGRSGRFRIFTNLTEEMYQDFSVEPSTPMIRIRNIQPNLPYIVDASLLIGPAPTGNYGIRVKYKEKVVWERGGIIRVVRPNVGETGLVQRVIPEDGFHRPGDQARFRIQGSGFRPDDANRLSVDVEGMEVTSSTFSYVAPGRMDLVLTIPLTAGTTVYPITVLQEDKKIIRVSRSFGVVGKNWARGLRVEPTLYPGGEALLILEGRDMDADFISSIQIDVDEPALQIDPFKSQNRRKAVARITAGPDVAPGDYWLKMSSKDGPVTPQFGSIIQVQEKN